MSDDFDVEAAARGLCPLCSYGYEGSCDHADARRTVLRIHTHGRRLGAAEMRERAAVWCEETAYALDRTYGHYTDAAQASDALADVIRALPLSPDSPEDDSQ